MTFNVKHIAQLATTSLVLGAIACGGAPKPADDAAGAAAEGAEAKACCKAKNECKGKGSCKVEGKNECAGKNECKGQGGCNGHCPK